MSNTPPTLEQIAAWYAANPQSAAGPAPAPAAPAPPPPAFGPPPGWPQQPEPRTPPPGFAAPQPPAQNPGPVSFSLPTAAPAQQSFAPVGNVPAAATAALVAIQTSQPAPINPPESVAALQPDAAPPPEKRKRGSRQAAAKSGRAAAASPASAPTGGDPGFVCVADATTEELVAELISRGYSGVLNFGQGG